MRALDTNVVLRVILGDDPAQSLLARRLLAQPALIGWGVLMETAWVLQSSYRQPRGTVATALSGLLDIPTVHIPDEAAVRWAIERYRDHGADFADMLHVVAAKGAERFASFERSLARQAGERSPVPIEHVA